MEYSFTELVDLKKVKAIAESLYKLTGIPPSIIDLEGNVLAEVAWQSICTDFHRIHPKTRAHCLESNTRLALQLNRKTGYACYECLNGLMVLAVPIVIGETHVANLFASQFFFSPPDKEFFRKQAATHGFDEKKYLDALDRVPVFSREMVELAMHCLSDLASLLGEMGLSQKRLTDMNRLLEQKVRDRTKRLEQEIEERKKAEAEKIKAGKLQGVLEMAGAAAHEFSQPLQALSLDAGYLAEQLAGSNEKIGEALQALHDNINALGRLISKVQHITSYEVTDYTPGQQIIDLDKASRS